MNDDLERLMEEARRGDVSAALGLAVLARRKGDEGTLAILDSLRAQHQIRLRAEAEQWELLRYPKKKPFIDHKTGKLFWGEQRLSDPEWLRALSNEEPTIPTRTRRSTATIELPTVTESIRATRAGRATARHRTILSRVAERLGISPSRVIAEWGILAQGAVEELTSNNDEEE